MALGVTHQLPVEERHIYKREYIADSLVVRLGGRVAEELIFGHQSTGAQNDLVGNTELARKMVREWGMSDRIGPMAWGSQGAVFLGEDLMHSRDYSDETARVIDEEVEHILRDEEDRCRKTLEEYRAGLDVAYAPLVEETLDGSEVERLVDEAWGHNAGGPARSRRRTAPRSRRKSCPRATRWRAATTPSERPPHQPLRGVTPAAGGRLVRYFNSPSSGSGVEPGARASATAAHRSVAVKAPTNAARTTPSPSTTTVVGIPAIS
jgi:hypothetical protein